MSRVSVIIPTFDRSALLAETLASVLAQTFGDHEIIVVDDGSTDDTRDRLEAEQTRLVYRRIEHAGAGAARNVGIEMAQGEFVAFLDSDDLWDSRFLEKMVSALGAHAGAGFAYCDYETFDDHGTVRAGYLQPHEQVGGSLFAALLAKDFLCTGALLIRRTCFKTTGGFDKDLYPVEDWDMWLRLAQAFDGVCVNESLVRIRMNPAHSSRDPSVVYSKNLRVLEKLKRDQTLAAHRHASIIRRQTILFHRGLARSFRARRQYLPALKHAYLMLSARFT